MRNCVARAAAIAALSLTTALPLEGLAQNPPGDQSQFGPKVDPVFPQAKDFVQPPVVRDPPPGLAERQRMESERLQREIENNSRRDQLQLPPPSPPWWERRGFWMFLALVCGLWLIWSGKQAGIARSRAVEECTDVAPRGRNSPVGCLIVLALMGGVVIALFLF